MPDPYVYPGTDVLKNTLGIRDRKKLEGAEADYVSLRLRELAEKPLPGDYGLAHMASMHKYIFQDIYEWAGKIRTVNMEKEEPALGGLSIEYSDKGKISDDLSRALRKMTSCPWTGLSMDDKVKYFQRIWRRSGKYMASAKAIPALPLLSVASL